jgi:hypothetical protein
MLLDEEELEAEDEQNEPVDEAAAPPRSVPQRRTG